MACQMAGIAATPLVLGQMDSTTTSAVTDEGRCTCAHGKNAECPMHKQTKPASAPRGTQWCSGSHDTQEGVLTTLVGFAGTLVQRHQPAAPEGVSASLGALLERPLDIVRPPVSPPPRN